MLFPPEQLPAHWCPYLWGNSDSFTAKKALESAPYHRVFPVAKIPGRAFCHYFCIFFLSSLVKFPNKLF
jgi:hypothetical protein